MIVAHLSDLHLGHRAFARNERGQNVRERDMAAAFRRAVEGVIAEEPDLILISGDVFDRPDPSPGALVALARGLDQLSRALPHSPVYMVAGARDTPRRTDDAGALAAMDTFPNVEAEAVWERAIEPPGLDARIVLLPYRATLMRPGPVPEPNPGKRWNLAVAHGRVHAGAGGLDLTDERWDYLALGGLHSFRQVSPRAAYAGALERVGPAPWEEAAEEKGFVVADLESGEIRFVAVPGRPVVDMAPTRVPPGDPVALQSRILEVTREIPGGIDGKIVRICIRGPGPDDIRGLEPGFLASLADRALHLSLELEEVGAQGAPVRTPREYAREALEGADDRTAALLDSLLGAGVGG
jgi:DNA repair exonuclease SbcCD nuclease subunit